MSLTAHTAPLQILRLQTRVLGDTSKHLRLYLFEVVERGEIVGPALLGKCLVGTQLTFDSPPNSGQSGSQARDNVHSPTRNWAVRPNVVLTGAGHNENLAPTSPRVRSKTQLDPTLHGFRCITRFCIEAKFRFRCILMHDID